MKAINVLNGKFGKRVLKEPYRTYWQIMTWGTIGFLFIRFIMFPFFNWWDKVVAFLNYVIWG